MANKIWNIHNINNINIFFKYIMSEYTKEIVIHFIYLTLYIFIIHQIILLKSIKDNSKRILYSICYFLIFSISLYFLTVFESFYLYHNLIRGVGYSISFLILYAIYEQINKTKTDDNILNLFRNDLKSIGTYPIRKIINLIGFEQNDDKSKSIN